LIIDKLVRENNFDVSPDELKEFAKKQLFGYMGMLEQDAEEQPWMAEYVNRMMHDRKFVEEAYHRIQTEKVFAWAEGKAAIEEKAVSLDDFEKELSKHKH
jgi:trigger factor